MALGYHLVFFAYGFWLPNDPRGSWSDFVAAWELLRFGAATKTTTRRSVAHATHDRLARAAAKSHLKHPPVVFTGEQARSIGVGFSHAIEESGYTVHACSIMPEHVHAVVMRHALPSEKIMGHLKTRATQRLIADGYWSPGRSPWSANGWSVYLNTPADVRRAIGYVEANPVKEGLPAQRWRFVRRYEG
jgi:REP element-mobilizing transposase RayT